jgi:hypothetical protein
MIAKPAPQVQAACLHEIGQRDNRFAASLLSPLDRPILQEKTGVQGHYSMINKKLRAAPCKARGFAT